MTDMGSEEWRAVCEARHWLRKGYTTSSRVDDLMARIEGERGQIAAKALREEMRRQWRARKEWMGSPE